MAKYIRQCKGVSEVESIDETDATPVKKRKLSSGEFNCIELRTSSGAVTSPSKSYNSGHSDNFSDQSFKSHCSSNGSSELVYDRFKSVVADLEGKGFEFEKLKSSSRLFYKRERRETTPTSDLMDSTDKSNSCQKSKMPSNEEIDEFFAVAEKVEAKRFTEKFNYDVLKDVPLEGRYEWTASN